MVILTEGDFFSRMWIMSDERDQRGEQAVIPEPISQVEICRLILEAGAVDIRDVDAGEEPFEYSSGNFGPGYVNIKGLVGRQEVFKTLSEQLALRVIGSGVEFDFINGNATGGMIPGWQLKEDVQRFTGRHIPYTYARNTRKVGGHRDIITGITNNPEIPDGARALVVEELINFAQTSVNSALAIRELGHSADNVATILNYENPKAKDSLSENGVSVVQLTSLPTLLDVAVDHGFFSQHLVDGYREFLSDPQKWQSQRGITPKTL